MTVGLFYQVIGAVIIGNLLSATVVLFFIRSWMLEREGKSKWAVPFYITGWAIAAMVLAAIAAWSTTIS